MREVPEEERDAWIRALRERARQDVEDMVPRPPFPVYGLAAPAVTPAALTEHTRVNGELTSITLVYGDWDATDGPYVCVITSATDAFATPSAGSTTMDGEQGEESLRFAIDDERDRIAALAEHAAEPDPSAPPVVFSREMLPIGPALAGSALVGRSGTVWAVRLQPAGAEIPVTVTVVGRGLSLESVLLQTVTELRPMFDARNEIMGARIARARAQPRPPLPELEPAEGVAALRALAENALVTHGEIHTALRARRRPRPDTDPGRLRSALWQRAVAEYQRIRGTDKRTADDAVTLAINHLGFLLEKAPWFTADPRLRAAATDETLRHVLLADRVPSEAAQDAWALYWTGRQMRHRDLDADPADLRAHMAARQAQTDDWLRAWAAWAETA
jgi:hypothetical protein